MKKPTFKMNAAIQVLGVRGAVMVECEAISKSRDWAAA
jgi:hypothetical protein